jgi:hypothetical protein
MNQVQKLNPIDYLNACSTLELNYWFLTIGVEQPLELELEDPSGAARKERARAI